jgi:prepilin-type N-terminal cleavage/methylation domain-containing protein
MTLHRPTRSQKGFSLIEIMIVLLILSAVLAVVFTDISRVQQRYRTETAKLDITQESREFLDQIVRDLRMSGFPAQRLFTYGILNLGGNPPDTDNRAAVGLVYVSASDLVFEGDVDGSGTVYSVRYTLRNSGGTCPCSLQRSQRPKVAGDPRPNDLGGVQSFVYNVEMQNVINSGGAFAIAGTNRGGIANDVLYGAMKAAPVFQFFDQNGNAIAGLPLDATNAAQRAVISTIRQVQINMNVMSQTMDLQSGTQPALSMTATTRLSNY